jgi:SAM-dependent methyltransferase
VHWSHITNDPNSPEAQAYRSAQLRAARRPPVSDRTAYITMLAKDRRVLDIGSVDHDADVADAFSLHRALAGASRTCVGADIVAPGVARLVEEGFDVRVADVSSPDFAATMGDGVYDLVVAGELIEHLGNLSALFENVRSVLALEGRLVLTTPNPYCFRLIVGNLRGHAGENVDHVAYCFPSGMAELADRHGYVLDGFRGALTPSTGKPSLRRKLSTSMSSLPFIAREASCETLIYEFTPA